jgi:glutamyl-tRNA synthetase
MTVRVRFAPSPTGMLHVGGVRTALFNYLFARQTGGEFILRIENTNMDREVARATDQIQESLGWLGLSWDGPVRFQSDRFDQARAAARRLVAEGAAYEEHDPEKGTAIRFRVPEGVTSWQDAVKGEVRFDNAQIKDFVILRADGSPLYNLASPLDDALDGITHVIRGDDHVSNTPKQIMLLRALGYEPPVYAHLPLVAGPDGKKLSKRHGAVGLEQFRAQGYLPETLCNFLALVGWAPGSGETKEIYTLDELVEVFRLSGIGEAMGRFDYEKLRWMNGQYLRALPGDEFAYSLSSYLHEQGLRLGETVLAEVAPLCQEKIATFGEFPSFAGYFFSRQPVQAIELLDAELLGAMFEALYTTDEWTAARIGEILKSVCEKQGVKPRNGLRSLYVAITGTTVGASIFHSLEILGREESLARVEGAIGLASTDAAVDRVKAACDSLLAEASRATTMLRRELSPEG